MLPILGKEGLPLDKNFKFVRVQNDIAYGDQKKGHDVIAQQNGLPNSVASGQRRTVNDGGNFVDKGDNIFITGTTTSCSIIGDEEKARNKTSGIVSKLTGKTVITV